MPQKTKPPQEQEPAAQPAGAEHTQLWLFVQEHYRKIILVICLIILTAAASSGYQYYQSQRLEQTRQELSRINSKLQGQEKQQALQQLLSEAPQQMERAVLLELANTAQDLEDFPSAIEYWSQLAQSSQDPGLQAAARLGQARALAKQDKTEDSLQILQETLQQAPQDYQEPIYFEMAALAEEAQDWEKALEAYQFLAQKSDLGSRQEDFLQYKISQLEQRLDSNGA
jgi:predicted negative regulator of RcsB-dependent stress response